MYLRAVLDDVLHGFCDLIRSCQREYEAAAPERSVFVLQHFSDREGFHREGSNETKVLSRTSDGILKVCILVLGHVDDVASRSDHASTDNVVTGVPNTSCDRISIRLLLRIELDSTLTNKG